jgi:hypothetical protein
MKRFVLNLKEASMKAIDLVRFSLVMSDQSFQSLLFDLREHPMATQAPSGGNHAIWILGHLTVIEAGLPGISDGEPNPLSEWEPLFMPGTTPTRDAKAYPGFDELLGLYREHRARSMEMLEHIGDAGLDRVPKHIPPGFEEGMATVGRTFTLMALHQMFHSGQLADIRRALGLKPRM